ncbi:MAG: carboxymuconolactone decarboxylase family protein [Acetobacteraceae bacterium]|nr:carboxymuconolactone decarboxylase family protein [Acetobacteraceae bacterium]
MARIPILREDDPALSEGARAYLEEMREARGRLVNIYRGMANRPEAARAFSGLAYTVYRGRTSLDPKHAELAYLTATVVNNCYY